MLSQLVRANLVNFADGRFTLLETLRSFAFEQLVATGRLAAASQHAHATYFTTFAQAVFTGLIGDDQATWDAARG